MGSVIPKWIFSPLKSFPTMTINTDSQLLEFGRRGKVFRRLLFLLPEKPRDPKPAFGAGSRPPCPRRWFEPSLLCSPARPACPGLRGVPSAALQSGYISSATRDLCSSLPFLRLRPDSGIGCLGVQPCLGIASWEHPVRGLLKPCSWLYCHPSFPAEVKPVISSEGQVSEVGQFYYAESPCQLAHRPGLLPL
ncbi:uncharacterized protein LOC125320914 isoform X2 [Corvus hawaiiensis]|uniref:uncharacterized protein LOC125320914 isoform X2 n=1 Tax=Corvus hawaiiensis TaxID=134902 RepID=UPI0020190404|nr:uncharacterized protein LOC125320914 isoform X2 [Corvus hawaiiensis]